MATVFTYFFLFQQKVRELAPDSLIASWVPWAVLVVFGLFFLILRSAFALGVYSDARFMMDRKKGPFLVRPFFWAVVVLIGGIWTVVVYWVIHHSTLRYRGVPNGENHHASTPNGEKPAMNSEKPAA